VELEPWLRHSFLRVIVELKSSLLPYHLWLDEY